MAMCELSLAMDCFQWQQSVDLDSILKCLAQLVGDEEIFQMPLWVDELSIMVLVRNKASSSENTLHL